MVFRNIPKNSYAASASFFRLARFGSTSATLRSVKRTRGIAQREAKPLLREDLFRFLDAIGDSMKGARDRASLLIGFAGGFRRSEVCAITCTDIDRVRQGMIISLRRSKTDQEGAGRKVGGSPGEPRHCLVVALDRLRDR
ncbi:MAG: hypothetical protein ABSE69_09305, partial [Roseiarcus sp.]